MGKFAGNAIVLSFGLFFTAFMAVIFSAADVSACAVCYGDPNSQMTKAMAAGIWVLLGCIAFLLMSFGGLFIFWMQRSRRVRAMEIAGEAALNG